MQIKIYLPFNLKPQTYCRIPSHIMTMHYKVGRVITIIFNDLINFIIIL